MIFLHLRLPLAILAASLSVNAAGRFLRTLSPRQRAVICNELLQTHQARTQLPFSPQLMTGVLARMGFHQWRGPGLTVREEGRRFSPGMVAYLKKIADQFASSSDPEVRELAPVFQHLLPPSHTPLIQVYSHPPIDDRLAAHARAEGLYEIQKIPPRLLALALKSGRGLILTMGPITQFPEMALNRGVIPRGWKLPWDNIPGAGGGEIWNSPALVNVESLTQGHGSQNLVVHEMLHNVDYARGDHPGLKKFSDEPEFRRLWTETKFLKADWYEATYPQEAFAELGAAYFDSEASRQELRDNYPEWYEYFRQLETH